MSNLIKCLECRLVGAPPPFTMPPPPAPPVQFFQQFNLSNKLITDQLKQIKLKKCLDIKSSNLATNLNESSAKRVQSSLLASSNLESMLQRLTPDQSLFIFVACLLVFILVLIVAFIFIYKLIRLRNELNKTCSSKSSGNLLAENGSINSNSSMDDKSQFTSYNLIPLYDSASNVSTASKNTSTSYLFYNQLFESTKHLMANSSSSSSPKSRPSDYYLHGVPNSSNLIESHLINSKKLARPHALQEYDEINSQCYQADKVYNQYDDTQKFQMIVQPVLPIRHLFHYPQTNAQILNARQLQSMNFVC
ncbi:hypothetical protein BpHYR1_016721 [Brachionus plicatilis]|uniref:Uncharacterized protein n=1 Tax=Brachionus plicatilis TaxID=10195 RepID=A0A3M7QKJ4_BRAPC|nr:hypothetical protein BpHYR1_016721 [Brachionus plicatilis]